jgi:hypothetical protein
MSDKEYEVRFAPGAFDSFEGTQEELDELVAEIKNLAMNGNLEENSYPVDMDQLEQDDPELYETLSRQLENINRKLN